MKMILKSFLLLFVAGSVVSCSEDNPVVPFIPVQTVSSYVAANPDFTLLKQALDRANLTETLNSTGNYTVFAPNNAAFTLLLQQLNLDSVDQVPVATLKQLLLNHVIGNRIASTDLTTTYIPTLAMQDGTNANLSLYINTEDDAIKLNGYSTVLTSDIIVGNGVIHAIDKVIPLPTIVTFATADPEFSSLVLALTTAGQPDYVTTLSTPAGTSPAPFTVFAPTNDAFSALLTELNISSVSDIPAATLTAALNTHVKAGANIRGEELENGDLTTLGDTILVNADLGSLTDKRGRVSELEIINIQATNGVMHAISKVLLPQE